MRSTTLRFILVVLACVAGHNAHAHECEQIETMLQLKLAFSTAAFRLPRHLTLEDQVLKEIAAVAPLVFRNKKGRIQLTYFESWKPFDVREKTRGRNYESITIFDTISSKDPFEVYGPKYTGSGLIVPPLSDRSDFEPFFYYMCQVER